MKRLCVSEAERKATWHRYEKARRIVVQMGPRLVTYEPGAGGGLLWYRFREAGRLIEVSFPFGGRHDEGGAVQRILPGSATLHSTSFVVLIDRVSPTPGKLTEGDHA